MSGFGMCSTFKFPGQLRQFYSASIWETEHLDRRIEYGESDLLEYAPVSKEHVKEGGMTLVDICAAAVQWSDKHRGQSDSEGFWVGPKVVTAFIRSTGDKRSTRPRQTPKPELNVVGPRRSEEYNHGPRAW